MKTKYILSIVVAIIVIGILGTIFYLQKTGRFVSPILTPIIGSVCGNDVCESGETSDNCCLDCACQTGYKCVDNKCQNICGDGICVSGETSATCCQDCGCPSGQRCVNNRCETYCGNGICDAGESSANCCKDCGCPSGLQCVNNVCQTYCGNGVCDAGETYKTCPQDCKSSEFSLSLYDCKRGFTILEGCIVVCDYSLANTGNAPAPDTKLYVVSSNYATGEIGDYETIALGTIYSGGTSKGSFNLDTTCGWDVVLVKADAYDTTETRASAEAKIY